MYRETIKFELHTFRCSDTLLGKLNRMQTCAQPNNFYEFALFCLTVSKETKFTY